MDCVKKTGVLWKSIPLREETYRTCMLSEVISSSEYRILRIERVDVLRRRC